MSRGEIIEALGLKDRMHFVNEYLEPALNAGLVEMRIQSIQITNYNGFYGTHKIRVGGKNLFVYGENGSCNL